MYDLTAEARETRFDGPDFVDGGDRGGGCASGGVVARAATAAVHFCGKKHLLDDGAGSLAQNRRNLS